MKKVSLFSLLIFYLVFNVNALEAKDTYGKSSYYPKLNGVQVFVLDKIYLDNLDTFFKELKSKDIDTVFFRVFHNQSDRPHLSLNLACSSGVYFQTTQTCVVNDLLPAIISVAKKYNIKIYAWLATRSLTFLKTDDNISRSFSPDGTIINGYGANIFKPNVRQSIINIFADLAKYDIDGILFQDDFIIKYNEGADEITRALFKSETGFEPTPSVFFKGIREYNGKMIFSGYLDIFYIWSLWKHEHLMKLFRDIKVTVKKVNPNIMLAANVYYETPMETDKAMAWYGQSINGLLNAGADYLAVMGYVEQIADEKHLTDEESASYISELTKKTVYYVKDYARMIIKLQSRSFKEGRSFINDNLSYLICNKLTKYKGISMSLVPINSTSDIINQCL